MSAGFIAMGASLASGAAAEMAGGDIAKQESKVKARAAELGAVQREADRKSRLAEALATQNARAGAAGISAFEGSPLAILEADIAAEETATERDLFSTQLEVAAIRTRGSLAKKMARTKAFSKLLTAGGKAMAAGGGGGG
jgi:hypothetical protein